MLIKNGRVHDGLGAVAVQDLRIEDGVIAALGRNLTAGEGEEVFDAAGMEILPGFVQAISSWGVNGSMTEIRPSSEDNSEKSDPVTPELDAFYSFNGRAATAQQLGAFGLTACGVAPADTNLFGGQIAAFAVDGVNPYKMCLKRGIGMMSSVTGGVKALYGAKEKAPQTRMWIFTNFDLQLKMAEEYKEEADAVCKETACGEGAAEEAAASEAAASEAAVSEAAAESGADVAGESAQETQGAQEAGAAKDGAEAKKDPKLRALKLVTEGRLPLFVACDSAAAIGHVRAILEKYPKVRLVLVNGFGLTGEEDWLVEKQVPVIVRTAANPLDKAAMKLSWEGIARLVEKGVPVALGGTCANGFGAREDMLWNSAEMMRRLHDSEKVLSMVTSVPAKILGLEEQTGAVREGLRADLVIWSANPMETWQARVVRTYMGGRVIYREGDEMKCM